MLIITAAFAGVAYLTLAAVIVFLLLERRTDRRDTARERSELLNRIKPGTAQYIPRPDNQPVPPNLGHIGLDDDKGYWDENMTPEQLAEHLFKQELEAQEAVTSGVDA